MKILKFFSPLLLFILVSCGEDDSSPSNEIKIDGESFPLVNGYYFDIESAEEESGRIHHGTHYTQAFLLTDGTVTESGGELACNDCTFEVFIESNSAGGDSFDSDEFNSENPESGQLSSTAAESYFFLTAESTDDSQHYTSIEGGSVSIDVHTPKFTFMFDLMANDQSDESIVADFPKIKITGQFIGTFKELDAGLLEDEH